ncbi:hypothetical protein Pst134EB_027631 [Puccinia striiformis f. sp. tritici]|uniref:Uncharacterized protein n=1 Tax=Puccinia striiformis f. sp. tritici PST-78 TaxID=1165861 RepID=A0A0L0VSN7_9BASI|nr:hypothetical protein Pst134EB_027631 [Puccinia striiformis f. sp. tritici]KNF02286.1 hypothetical protein PSTG_04494 [Puccinia striiformis f. sp. tritici PST-78]
MSNPESVNLDHLDLSTTQEIDQAEDHHGQSHNRRSSAKLDSINEDHTITQPDYLNPPQTPMVYGGFSDTPSQFSSIKFGFEANSPISKDQHSPAPSDQIYRKWSGSFYVWIHDTIPTTTTAPTISSTPSDSNSIMTANSSSTLNLAPTQPSRSGGRSKHFFKPTTTLTSPTEPPKPSRLLIGKKDRRAKLSLITGLTKQRDTTPSSQLESPAALHLNSHRPNLDPNSLSEHLDSLTDRSTLDSIEISKLNQSRFPSSNLNSTEQSATRSKRHPFNSESKLGRRKAVPSETSNNLSGTSSIASQLSLGPGAAMNSKGVGSGQWKLVQGVITEDGHFTLHTGNQNEVILYRIYLPSYRRTDIRMVHQSIFGRPHCGVITQKTGGGITQSSNPLTSSTSLPLGVPSSSLFPASINGSLTSLTPSTTSSHLMTPNTTPTNLSTPLLKSTSQQSDSSIAPPELSIYICMPNSILLESWLVICKCFCRPDDFRHLYPRANKKNQKGVVSKGEDTTQPSGLSPPVHPENTNLPSFKKTLSSSPKNSSPPERVRIWRGIEIQLLEGKKLGEVRQVTLHNQPGSALFNGSTKFIPKEERRNSTGGFSANITTTTTTTGCLSPSTVNKDSSQSSNFSQNQTAQQDPPQSQQTDHQSKLYSQRFTPKKIGIEPQSSMTGFSSSITSNLNQVGVQNPGSNSNFNDKPGSSSMIITPSNDSSKLSINSFSINNNNNSPNDNFYFIEFDWDNEVIGRSTIKRNLNPYWSESFKFSELGSFKTPLIMNVYRIKRNFNQQQQQQQQTSSPSSSTSSIITLIGQTQLDLKSFEKNIQLQLWLPIYSNPNSDNNGTDENCNQFDINNQAEIMGEINLSITVVEQVVLAEPEYAKMMVLLNNDEDVELPLNLANMAVGELDRLAELLIRIYESSDRLYIRFSQLAAIEINGDLSTASILFRANTLLTKMLEAYMRIVGRSFLESSVGVVIRRICMSKIELEIDPSKLKSSLSSHQKEKIVNENVKELKKIANEIWQTMYLNRSKCPNRLRKIFVKIQKLVGNAYDDQNMRLTSISAFVFLRFFVPAILNPRLFNLIQFQPDSKSQRTLTLIAKTVQGLGNLTLFGIKEPWMSAMNEFITTHIDSFRDYISFIASESDSTRPEWTSKEYEGYGLPYALKASLPPSSRDGIPSLPHLLDPVRDCSLLASLMTIIRRKALDSSKKNHSSVLPPKTPKMVEQFATSRPRRANELDESSPTSKLANSTTTEFLKICGDLYAKSERRYQKIIQSEQKQPKTLNKNITTCANSVDHTFTMPATTLPALSTQIRSPTSTRINSRKCTFDSHNSLSPNKSTSITTSPSNMSSNPRWRRSHTITAEQASSLTTTLFDHHHLSVESPDTSSKHFSLAMLGLGHRATRGSSDSQTSPTMTNKSPTLPSSSSSSSTLLKTSSLVSRSPRFKFNPRDSSLQSPFYTGLSPNRKTSHDDIGSAFRTNLFRTRPPKSPPQFMGSPDHFDLLSDTTIVKTPTLDNQDSELSSPEHSLVNDRGNDLSNLIKGFHRNRSVKGLSNLNLSQQQHQIDIAGSPQTPTLDTQDSRNSLPENTDHRGNDLSNLVEGFHRNRSLKRLSNHNLSLQQQQQQPQAMNQNQIEGSSNYNPLESSSSSIVSSWESHPTSNSETDHHSNFHSNLVGIKLNKRPHGSGTLMVDDRDDDHSPDYSQDHSQQDHLPETENSPDSFSGLDMDERSTSLLDVNPNRTKGSDYERNRSASSSSSVSLDSLRSSNSPSRPLKLVRAPSYDNYDDDDDQEEEEGSNFHDESTPTDLSTASINLPSDHPTNDENNESNHLPPPKNLVTLSTRNQSLINRRLSSSPSSPILRSPSTHDNSAKSLDSSLPPNSLTSLAITSNNPSQTHTFTPLSHDQDTHPIIPNPNSILVSSPSSSSTVSDNIHLTALSNATTNTFNHLKIANSHRSAFIRKIMRKDSSAH